MSVELPVLEALYALQKLVEPLPEPEEVTITTDSDYLRGMGSNNLKVGVTIYVNADHLDKWTEAVEEARKNNDAIGWEVF